MCDHCGCRTLTPVARLMAEHDRLRELTGLIQHALDRDEAAVAAELFHDLLVVLGPHVRKEEGALFPMLREQDELTDHVDLLESEHAGLYDAVDDLPAQAAGATGVDPGWRRGVLALLHDLDEHMFKEDFGLFPAAIATLDGSDWDAMETWERDTGSFVDAPADTPV